MSADTASTIEEPDESPGSKPWLPPLLLLLTFITTTLAGVALSHNLGLGFLFWEPLLVVVDDPLSFMDGLSFSMPLLAIFITHEMGHFVAAKRLGIDASLPYFVPVPFGLGTFGAIIGMRSMSRDRGGLIEVGAAGPLVGFVVAFAVLLLGFSWSELKSAAEIATIASSDGLSIEGDSLVYALARWLVYGTLEPGADVWIHPTAWAGWLGMYLTWFNLQPFGQFDGGHVSYALFGKHARKISLAVFAYLVAFYAFTQNGFWLSLFILHIVFWGLMGIDHPPVEDSRPLAFRHKLLALACVLVFIATFVPNPWQQISPEDAVQSAAEVTEATP